MSPPKPVVSVFYCGVDKPTRDMLTRCAAKAVEALRRLHPTPNARGAS